MGTNCWNTFVIRVEHPYIVGKLVKSLDMGEPTFYAKKTAWYQLQQQTKAALAMQTTLKTAQKALNKGCSAWNQTISLTITSSAECT